MKNKEEAKKAFQKWQPVIDAMGATSDNKNWFEEYSRKPMESMNSLPLPISIQVIRTSEKKIIDNKLVEVRKKLWGIFDGDKKISEEDYSYMWSRIEEIRKQIENI